jgi:hypothetical protein
MLKLKEKRQPQLQIRIRALGLPIFLSPFWKKSIKACPKSTLVLNLAELAKKTCSSLQLLHFWVANRELHLQTWQNPWILKTMHNQIWIWSERTRIQMVSLRLGNLVQLPQGQDLNSIQTRSETNLWVKQEALLSSQLLTPGVTS